MIPNIKEIITDIISQSKEIEIIIDKYDNDSNLYQNSVINREDSIQLSTMLFYLSPGLGLIKASVEELINDRKREKSKIMRQLMHQTDDATDKKFTASAAEHEARSQLLDIDKKIASFDATLRYGTAIMFATKDIIFQLNECRKSLSNEIRMTGGSYDD